MDILNNQAVNPEEDQKQQMIRDYIQRQMQMRQQLVDAQDAANQQRLGANLGSAASKIGAAIAGSGAKADTSGFDTLAKQADQPVKDLQAQQKMDMDNMKMQSTLEKYKASKAGKSDEDANSTESKLFKRYIIKNRPDLINKLPKGWETQSKKQIKFYLDDTDKLNESKIKQEQHADIRKEKKNMKALTRRNKDEAAYQKALAQVRGLGRGTANQMGNMLNRERLSRNALRIVDLVEKGEIKGTEQIANELAIAMTTMLTGGSAPAERMVREMIPETAVGSVGAAKQYILSKPQQFLTPKFLEHFKHQIKAEGDFYRGELKGVTGSILRSLDPVFNRRDEHGKLVNEDLKDTFAAELQAFGQEKGIDQPTQSQSAQPKTITKKQYNSKLNKTKFIYSDGSEEIKDGRL